MSQKDKRLFSTLAAVAEQSMRDFSSQNLANTAWVLTDSAAGALEIWCSEALVTGGAAGGWVEVGSKLAYVRFFVLSLKIFMRESFDVQGFCVCLSMFHGFWQVLESFSKLETSKIIVFV